jgi:hypothetical protein
MEKKNGQFHELVATCFENMVVEEPSKKWVFRKPIVVDKIETGLHNGYSRHMPGLWEGTLVPQLW